MMQVRLSSKGQMVIPQPVRKALNLWPGTQLWVQVADGKIILEPVSTPPIDLLYGRYPNANLLADLEEEHRQEIEHERTLRP